MSEVKQVTIEDIIEKQKENYPNCNEELIRKELNDIQHAINEDKKRADAILARVWRKVAVAKVLEKKLEKIANGKEN